jgi:membrane-associated phospholipid phosphatase
MNFLENIDKQVFFFINNTLHNNFLDGLMPYWRSMYLWAPLYIFLIAYLIINYGKIGLILIASIIATVAISDITSSQIIKKTFHRARPCNDSALKSQVKLLVRCGSGYSFTSSHATNHFAVATFLFFTFAAKRKWLKWGFMAWAFSIAIGQVYVGVHFPFDILCGGILGFAIGYLGVFLYKKYMPPMWQF